MKDLLLLLGALFCLNLGHSQVRIVKLDLDNDQVTIKNLGTNTLDVSAYQFCLGPGFYNALNDYDNIDGDLQLSPDEETTFNLNSGGENVLTLGSQDDLGLWANRNFGSSNPNDLLDFVQWGAAGQSRVSQAVTAGRWTSSSDFISGTSPYTFTGNGNDIGPSAWAEASVPIIRLLQVDATGERVRLKNFGTAEEDISGYFLCLGPGMYNQLNDYTEIEGDLILSPNEEVVFDVTSGSGGVQALPDANGGLGLWSTGGQFGTSNPEFFKDYVQWGAANQNRANQAVAAGRWDDVNNFVEDNSPFNYIGDADDVGADFWEGTAEEEVQKVIKFDLTDRNGNVLQVDLVANTVIDLADFEEKEFNIRATTEPTVIGSIYFELRGPVGVSRIENFFPYDLFGTGGSRILPVGDYHLTATPFAKSNARGKEGERLSISFTVIDSEAELAEVKRFDLTDRAGKVLQSNLQNGQKINIGEFSVDEFNIRATTDPKEVDFVRFELAGPIDVRRNELAFPYDLFGTFVDRKFPIGQYTLKAIPFTRSNGKEITGTPLTIDFEIIDEKVEEDKLLIEQFDLIDKNGNVLLADLANGEIIDISNFDVNEFNIRTRTNPDKVGYVAFELSGRLKGNRIEFFPPYDLFGTNGGLELPTGDYELTARPFPSLFERGGRAGEVSTIRFTIVDNGSTRRNTNRLAITNGQFEATEVLSMDVYPNPANSFVNLTLQGEARGRAQLRILNSVGVVVKTVDLEKRDDRLQQQLQLNGISKGLYFINVILNDEVKTSRLLIQK